MNVSDKREKGVPEKNRLLRAVYYAFFVNGMMSTLLGVILPVMAQEYGINCVLGGMLLSAHQVGNLCAVFAAGFLPYVIGRRKSTVVLCSGIVPGLVFITVTKNPAVLLAAFAAVGIGRGTMSNISNVVIAENSRDKTTAFNLLHAFFAIGALLSPFAVAAAARGSGWKTAVLAVAVLELAALFFIFRSPLSNRPASRPGNTRVLFFRSGSFWLNTAILFVYLCAESSIVGWLVTYFRDSGLMTMSLAQMTVTLLWLTVLGGRLFCSALSRRFSKNVLLVCMAAAETVFFLLMISAGHRAVVFPCLLGVGLSMAGIYPTTLSSMKPEFACSTAATGTCIAVATTGAIVMPVIVGFAAQRYGIAAGISTIGAALSVMLVLTVVKLFFSRRDVPVAETV